ncbi:MAG TPA: DNA helicase PcrA [Firmicutes bacterium]|nr:DNA helicase PcrA [Bacillota bacterium]
MNLLAELNEQQREAVIHGAGPLLVIAGAGSGKTRALTFRIAYLIKNLGVPPWEILAVTFTNKAAEEMKERVEELLGTDVDIWIGTFHATCVRILRREIQHLGMKPNFVIYDTQDQKAALKTCIAELDLDTKQYDPNGVLGAISRAKNNLITPEQYLEDASDHYEKTVARIYRRYQEVLASYNACDFDDLLVYTVRLFEEHPAVLSKYQDRFRWILVDEYQDTNHAQYRIVNLLASKHRNLCVVGDADQSIYAFRGADFRNILEFTADYPEAKVVKLEQNYRSSQNILEAANRVIEHNSLRPEKKLWTENPPGDPLYFFIGEDEREEARFVAGEILRLGDYKNIAILYRTHAQSRALEEEFMYRGVPYTILGGMRFYERKEIKDLIAYLRLVVNPDDDFSFQRIINVPRRGIGPATLEKIEKYAAEHGISLYQASAQARQIPGLGPRVAGALAGLVTLLEDCRKLLAEQSSVTKVADKLMQDSGYLAMLLEEKTPEAEARVENLKEFLTVTKQFDLQEEAGDLAAFLEQVTLVSDVDNWDEDADAVSMMTLHSAKGLEFPVVFMVGMEEGIFPNARCAFDPGELEEERRLCYVGITRARERLYLTCARYRTIYGMTRNSVPSQFINEIPKHLLETVGMSSGLKLGSTQDKSTTEFVPGEKIRHRVFGIGTVVKAVNSEITVVFEGRGLKVLDLNYAPVERV